jgi:hypothetical protein
VRRITDAHGSKVFLMGTHFCAYAHIDETDCRNQAPSTGNCLTAARDGLTRSFRLRSCWAMAQSLEMVVNDDSPIPAGWRLEECAGTFALSSGGKGYHVNLMSTRAVQRTGAEALVGAYKTIAAAKVAAQEVDASEARESFLLLYEFECMGVGPRDVERILRFAETCGTRNHPAALNDLDCPYRVGAAQATDARSFSGTLIGHYLSRAVLWWPKYGRDGNPLHERRR